MKYKTMKATSVEHINEILLEQVGWEPIFITPVNEIDSTGTKFDANKRPQRYFYYLIMLGAWELGEKKRTQTTSKEGK